MNRKTVTITGIFILAIIVFALPIIPLTYHIPYSEEVPILKLIGRTNVIVNSSSFTLEGGAQQFWHTEIDDYKTAHFVISANETITAAIMSLDEFESFQESKSIDRTPQSVIDAANIDIEYQAPLTETHFFVIHNPHDGLQGTENRSITINQATITETWEEESMDIEIVRGVRNVTTPVTIWQVITGTTPVF